MTIEERGSREGMGDEWIDRRGMGGRENEQGKGMRAYVGEMKREGGGGGGGGGGGLGRGGGVRDER